MLSGNWQIGSIARNVRARAGSGHLVSAHRSIPTRSRCTVATSTASKRPSGSSKWRGRCGWNGPTLPSGNEMGSWPRVS